MGYFFTRNVSSQVNEQKGKKEGQSGGNWGNGPGNEFVLGLVAVLFALWLLKVVADANRYVLLTYKQFENLLRDKKVRKIIQLNECVYYLILCFTVNVNLLWDFRVMIYFGMLNAIKIDASVLEWNAPYQVIQIHSVFFQVDGLTIDPKTKVVYIRLKPEYRGVVVSNVSVPHL